MINFRKILNAGRKSRTEPSVEPGRRYYAIGDIHGRYDLLTRLMGEIEKDNRQRSHADVGYIFLGDYIDRGPNSRDVIEQVMRFSSENDHVICLIGNHEEMLLATVDGDSRAAGVLHKMGGRATLLSYGVSPTDYDEADTMRLVDLARSAIPASHIDWLRNLADFHEAGDYIFVHAGLRPGIKLQDQRTADLRWIRREFLEFSGPHDGAMVVHGHTVSEDVVCTPNRIGIDTGAYASGILTALGLENRSRWFIQTSPD